MQRNPHSYQIATGYRTFYSLSLIYQPITKKRLFFREKQNKIANNKVVFLNISSCIQCSKCINVCPMNVFQKKDAILPIHGENCIQCQLCAKYQSLVIFLKKKTNFLVYLHFVSYVCIKIENKDKNDTESKI